jgi:uncharacterized protein YecE (DUF72 family)
MAVYRVGTSGWQYRHWRGLFYPPYLPLSRWFDFYARHFVTVEINNSFYRLPKDATWQRWHDMAPPGFSFAVKANRFLTHIKRLKDIEASLQRFLRAYDLLAEHAGPVLFQLPPNFHQTADNIARLSRLLAVLPAGRFAFEFRHPSWFGSESLALLRRHDAAFCCFDMHGFDCPVAATASFAYVRLHGQGTAYAGRYDEDALQLWARRLASLAHDVDEVWVYFNNDIGGHAVANALRLQQIVRGD